MSKQALVVHLVLFALAAAALWVRGASGTEAARRPSPDDAAHKYERVEMEI